MGRRWWDGRGLVMVIGESGPKKNSEWNVTENGKERARDTEWMQCRDRKIVNDYRLTYIFYNKCMLVELRARIFVAAKQQLQTSIIYKVSLHFTSC